MEGRRHSPARLPPRRRGRAGPGPLQRAQCTFLGDHGHRRRGPGRARRPGRLRGRAPHLLRRPGQRPRPSPCAIPKGCAACSTPTCASSATTRQQWLTGKVDGARRGLDAPLRRRLASCWPRPGPRWRRPPSAAACATTSRSTRPAPSSIDNNLATLQARADLNSARELRRPRRPRAARRSTAAASTSRATPTSSAAAPSTSRTPRSSIPSSTSRPRRASAPTT